LISSFGLTAGRKKEDPPFMSQPLDNTSTKNSISKNIFLLLGILGGASSGVYFQAVFID